MEENITFLERMLSFDQCIVIFLLFVFCRRQLQECKETIWVIVYLSEFKINVTIKGSLDLKINNKAICLTNIS